MDFSTVRVLVEVTATQPEREGFLLGKDRVEQVLSVETSKNDRPLRRELLSSIMFNGRKLKRSLYLRKMQF